MIIVHPDIARLIGVVYFIQGAMGISGIALPLFLRKYGFNIEQIAYFNSIVTLPWAFKIIFGAVSDAFPIHGLRRKPYIIICCILACSGWFLLSLVPPTLIFLIFAMLCANIGFAAIDVVTDGIVVEHSTKNTSQIYQNISWGARAIGALVSGIAGGYLAAHLDYRIIFFLTGFLPMVSILMVRQYREKRKKLSQKTNFLSPISKSIKKLFSGDLFWFCWLLIVVSLSSSFMTPLFFYMKEELQFGEKFLGLLSSVTWLGAVAGCFIYIRFFKSAPLNKTLYFTIGLGFFQILACLLIRDSPSAFLVSVTAGALGYLSLLPLMSSAARLAHNSGVESSLFAILMGIFNLGQTASTFLGGWLFSKIGLQNLIVLVAFLTLSGFWFIRRLKSL